MISSSRERKKDHAFKIERWDRFNLVEHRDSCLKRAKITPPPSPLPIFCRSLSLSFEPAAAGVRACVCARSERAGEREGCFYLSPSHRLHKTSERVKRDRSGAAAIRDRQGAREREGGRAAGMMNITEKGICVFDYPMVICTLTSLPLISSDAKAKNRCMSNRANKGNAQKLTQSLTAAGAEMLKAPFTVCNNPLPCCLLLPLAFEIRLEHSRNEKRGNVETCFVRGKRRMSRAAWNFLWQQFSCSASSNIPPPLMPVRKIGKWRDGGGAVLLEQCESNARIRHRVRLAPPQTGNFERRREGRAGGRGKTR